jgi:hypothetical protein
MQIGNVVTKNSYLKYVINPFLRKGPNSRKYTFICSDCLHLYSTYNTHA